jgi:peptidylprolyl isomerase
MHRLLSVLLSLTIGFSAAQNKEKVELVLIETEFGNIKVKLYNETPLHRDNFLKLADEGFYNGTLFHRVIKEFMIQGGDPDSKNASPEMALGNGGPGYTIPAEFVSQYYHKRGALAAARLGDNINPKKESSGSQFYIVHGRIMKEEELKMYEQRMSQQIMQQALNDFLLKPENEAYLQKAQKLQQENDQKGIQDLVTEITPIVQIQLGDKANYTFTEQQLKDYSSIGGAPHLDGGYTVFGEVIEGLDVIDKIAELQTNAQNRPAKDVKMTVKRVKK